MLKRRVYNIDTGTAVLTSENHELVRNDGKVLFRLIEVTLCLYSHLDVVVILDLDECL